MRHLAVSQPRGGQRLRVAKSRARPGNGVQQADKQPAVAAGRQRQMAVGDIAGGGARGSITTTFICGLSRFACTSR
jgi:hypothetical protein